MGLWATALAATVNEGFGRWMEPRLVRFVATLEQESGKHGFAIYLHKEDVVFSPRQVGSLAVDLEVAAGHLATRMPSFSKRMRELAALQDRGITKAGEPIHPRDALSRSDSNPASGRAYLGSLFGAADQVLEPILPKGLGKSVAKVTQPGRTPSSPLRRLMC